MQIILKNIKKQRQVETKLEQVNIAHIIKWIHSENKPKINTEMGCIL